MSAPAPARPDMSRFVSDKARRVLAAIVHDAYMEYGASEARRRVQLLPYHVTAHQDRPLLTWVDNDGHLQSGRCRGWQPGPSQEWVSVSPFVGAWTTVTLEQLVDFCYGSLA